MGIWGWGWGQGGGSNINLGGKQTSLCRNNQERGEGGEGGRRMGEAQTRTISGDGILYCQASILGRKLLATTLMLP